jgi:tungstate transport system ATP-binding protein
MLEEQTTRVSPLKAKNLSVSFDGKEILNIPSLHVLPGEVLAIMGPNGSGKTTLLLALALLLKPTTGTIYYDDKPVAGNSQVLLARRRTGVVFQDALLFNMTVRDNVALGLKLRGIKGEEADSRVRRWIERFGIAHLAKQPAKTLSGGEAKRASLARAFVLNPEILFLDEPFNSLDAPTRQSILGDFQSVLRETGVTTVMVTHDRNEALALADRIAVIMNGRMRIIGKTSVVISYTQDEEVAHFLDVSNVLHGVVEVQNNGLVTVRVGDLEIEAVSGLPAGIPVAVCLAQEDITLLLPSNQTVSSARNRFAGTIARMLPSGSLVRVTVDCGPSFAAPAGASAEPPQRAGLYGESVPLVAIITRRSWEDMGLEIGGKVIASFKASAINLIPQRHVTQVHE